MENNWAAENLLTIRTLMERSAIYRRALAPVMTYTGLVGIVAAVVAAVVEITSVDKFAGYWMVVSVVAMAGDFLLVRRQALKDGEPLWSPPTRRVSQALLPAFFIGFLAGFFFMKWLGYARLPVVLAMIWILLYGCAMHAAGFFMPRGIRLFAWAFIVGGAALMAVWVLSPDPLPPKYGNVIMGLFFGVAQLAYGVYLYFTEPRKHAT